jgi:protein-tyrosine sulfotransferase
MTASQPMDGAAPVFVLSCERSGSTLLRYILDTHPELACPGELIVGQLIRSLRLVLGRTRALALPAGMDAEAWTRAEVRRVVDEQLAAYAAARGKCRWAEKSPLNLHFLDDIVWAFPDAKFLCLYRRSLDVVNSCLDVSRFGFMAELAAYAQRNPCNLVAAMLENWVDKTETLLRFERSGAACLRVYYEALVNDPPGTLAGVFAFLGLPWAPAMLDEVFTKPHDPGGGDPKVRATRRIETDRIGTGGALDPRMLVQVAPDLQRRCSAIHLELGYPLWSAAGLSGAERDGPAQRTVAPPPHKP